MRDAITDIKDMRFHESEAEKEDKIWDGICECRNDEEDRLIEILDDKLRKDSK